MNNLRDGSHTNLNDPQHFTSMIATNLLKKYTSAPAHKVDFVTNFNQSKIPWPYNSVY